MIRHTLQVPWDTEYTTASEDNEVFQIAWNDQAMVLFMGTVSNGSKRIIRQCRRPARTATNVGDAVVMRGWARVSHLRDTPSGGLYLTGDRACL